jgi:hypothetical protein
MDVVDRYLLNVRTYLPRGRADEDVAELRENIRSQVEDREERLGRPLTEEERIAVLRAHGHPILVAGRYRSDGRRLVLGREVIGPDLFPFYRLSLLGVAAVTLLILAFSGVASIVEATARIPVFRTLIMNLAVLGGAATLFFALLDVHFRRTSQTWDPRKLPTSSRIPMTPARRRLGAVLQIVFTLAFLWIWIAIGEKVTTHGSRLGDLGPGPAWRLLYLGLVASSAISLVTPAMTLVRPTLHRFGWLVSLFSSGAFIAFAAASLWTSGWVVPASSPSAAGTIAAAQRINTWVAVGLGISVVMTALATVVEVVRGAWRELRRTGPA